VTPRRRAPSPDAEYEEVSDERRGTLVRRSSSEKLNAARRARAHLELARVDLAANLELEEFDTETLERLEEELRELISELED
jgi:DNA-binding GntR family transcriptional regulator